MNLLVTNTRNAQAYAITRTLRPHAEKIVVTMYGKPRLAARLSHAANSRLVDTRYYVPSPVEDWWAGNIGKENTEREEAYIQAVLRICELERIDTIFPSWDPQVYVFSKNKARFEERGVLIPIPDYETVLGPLDKYRTIRAAQEVGFPCPRTFLPEREEDLRWIAEEVGFPLVIKLRFTSGGRGMEMVQDISQLREKLRRVRTPQGMPLIQEYIPGNEKRFIFLVLGKNGEVKSACCQRIHRNFFRINANFVTAGESMRPGHELAPAIRLAQTLGWWGGMTVEAKVDPRDGLPKLMEVNPRLGLNLWTRTALGINEPLMCLKIARGEEVPPLEEYPVGTMLLSPGEDLLRLSFWFMDMLVYKFRTTCLGRKPFDPSNPPMAVRKLVQSYRQTYLGGKAKVFNPYFRYFFQDPLVSLLFWSTFFRQMWRARKQLGR